MDKKEKSRMLLIHEKIIVRLKIQKHLNEALSYIQRDIDRYTVDHLWDCSNNISYCHYEIFLASGLMRDLLENKPKVT